MSTYHCNGLSIVVSDMARTLAFYRLCGLDLPDTPDAPHVDATVSGGFRVMFDTEDTIRSFDPGWQPPSGGGHRAALALECDHPEAVDELHTRVVDAGYRSHLAPFDAFWGQRYAVVLDPDGTPVDLYAALTG